MSTNLQPDDDLIDDAVELGQSESGRLQPTEHSAIARLGRLASHRP